MKWKKHLSSLVKGGLRKKSLTAIELKTLAAVPVGVINLGSKPERSCVLAAMKVDEVDKWISGGKNLIRRQVKESVRNKMVVLPSNEVVKQGLRFYLDFIRPVLATGGKSASHLDCKKAAFILEADVVRANKYMSMDPDDWYKFLINEGIVIGNGHRSPPRWPMIFERCGPWNWDATLIKRGKRKVDYSHPPTLTQLRIAVNTRDNDSFLLDSCGDAMVRCGDFLSLICNAYAGVSMKPTMLRKLVTTEAKGHGDSMHIVDEALEHTADTSENHYQLKDMEKVGGKWAEIYEAGVDMADLSKHFADVAAAPVVAPRQAQRKDK
jgi:hypothetical protein